MKGWVGWELRRGVRFRASTGGEAEAWCGVRAGVRAGGVGRGRGAVIPCRTTCCAHATSSHTVIVPDLHERLGRVGVAARCAVPGFYRGGGRGVVWGSGGCSRRRGRARAGRARHGSTEGGAARSGALRSSSAARRSALQPLRHPRAGAETGSSSSPIAAWCRFHPHRIFQHGSAMTAPSAWGSRSGARPRQPSK